MSDIKEKVIQAFDKASLIYREQMENFYPTISDRGIDERNQVYIFGVSLRETLHPKKVFSWMESPFIANGKVRDRMDGVAYIPEENP